MKKLILSLIGASLWTVQGMAQQQLPKVVDKNGNLMDMPVFGSPEAESIARKRCGTYMESLSNSKNGQTRLSSLSSSKIRSSPSTNPKKPLSSSSTEPRRRILETATNITMVPYLSTSKT